LVNPRLRFLEPQLTRFLVQAQLVNPRLRLLKPQLTRFLACLLANPELIKG
jgi:hypothetical protein